MKRQICNILALWFELVIVLFVVVALAGMFFAVQWISTKKVTNGKETSEQTAFQPRS